MLLRARVCALFALTVADPRGDTTHAAAQLGSTERVAELIIEHWLASNQTSADLSWSPPA